MTNWLEFWAVHRKKNQFFFLNFKPTIRKLKFFPFLWTKMQQKIKQNNKNERGRNDAENETRMQRFCFASKQQGPLWKDFQIEIWGFYSYISIFCKAQRFGLYLCEVHLWSEHLAVIGRVAILWFRQNLDLIYGRWAGCHNTFWGTWPRLHG